MFHYQHIKVKINPINVKVQSNKNFEGLRKNVYYFYDDVLHVVNSGPGLKDSAQRERRETKEWVRRPVSGLDSIP